MVNRRGSAKYSHTENLSESPLLVDSLVRVKERIYFWVFKGFREIFGLNYDYELDLGLY